MPPPGRPLYISGIVNAEHPELPLVAGGMMAVRLQDPGMSGLIVQLDGVPAAGVVAGFDSAGMTALLMPLGVQTALTLRIGPVSVRVVCEAEGRQSQLMSSVVVPGLASSPDIEGNTICVSLALPLAAGSHAAILLYPHGPIPTPGVRLPCLPCLEGDVRVTAPVGATAPGEYLVSIEVDGVASLLDHEQGRYAGPLVKI